MEENGMRENNKLPKDMIDEFKDIYFEKDGNTYSILDIPPDPEILRRAREYDRKSAKEKRKRRTLKSLQIAAAFLLCFTTMSAIAMETSDAFRVRVYQLFEDKEQGGVTLFTQDEYDMISDWDNYWYPTYLPEGFTMIDAEKGDFGPVMVFRSEDGDEVRINEYSLDSRISMDTDHTTMEEVRIGYYKGYLFTLDENLYMRVFWMTDDRQLSVTMVGKLDKELLLQIAEGLEYKK